MTNNKTNRETLFAFLKSRGVAVAIVEFDGAGDSGQIQTYDFFARKLYPDNAQYSMIPDRESRMEFDDEAGQHVLAFDENGGVQSMTIREVLEQFCYKCLGETGIDWYNNDGGFGDIVFDVEKQSVEMEMNTRRVEVDTTYCTF